MGRALQLGRWCWRQHWRLLTTTMTCLRYAKWKFFIWWRQANYFCKDFQTFTSPPQVGVEGAGFEPILEALFGMRGFFTEIHSRVMLLGILHRLPNDVDRISIQVKWLLDISTYILCLLILQHEWNLVSRTSKATCYSAWKFFWKCIISCYFRSVWQLHCT